jgi:hypothetical protein
MKQHLNNVKVLPPIGAPPQKSHVPSRLGLVIYLHLYRILANLGGSLFLGVHGAAGVGKSHGVNTVLQQLGVKVVRLSGGLMESPEAGEPAQRLREAYFAANRFLVGPATGNSKTPSPTALVLEDVDTTALGNWGDHVQYTVNQQTSLAELMHWADSPDAIDGRPIRRVPVIFTGNDLTKIYAPLVRAGRMTLLHWHLRPAERIDVLAGIFPELTRGELLALAVSFDSQQVAFFADLRQRLEDERLMAALKGQSARAVLWQAVQGQRLPRAAAHITLEKLLHAGRALEASRRLTNHLGRSD